MAKDRVSAIADLQQTPCPETAKGHDHMAEWATASSLQLGRQIMGANERLKIRDSRWETGRSDGGMQVECIQASKLCKAGRRHGAGKAQAKCSCSRTCSPVPTWNLGNDLGKKQLRG